MKGLADKYLLCAPLDLPEIESWLHFELAPHRADTLAEVSHKVFPYPGAPACAGSLSKRLTQRDALSHPGRACICLDGR